MTEISFTEETYSLELDDGNSVEIGFADENGAGATITLYTPTNHVSVTLTDFERFRVNNALSHWKDDDTMEELIHGAIKSIPKKTVKARLVFDDDEDWTE